MLSKLVIQSIGAIISLARIRLIKLFNDEFYSSYISYFYVSH